jgi:hypothetical protein
VTINQEHSLDHNLPTRTQRPQPRGDDRERITRARQAAEALFTPKPSVSMPSAAESSPPNDQQSARKRRVLGITPPPVPVRYEAVEALVSTAPPATREIPRSEFARIRAWIKYGMKAAQVAEVYGAAVGDIERILRQA